MFADAGSPWIHVVDLDAARSGPVNRPVVAAIAGSVSTPVQAGGGVRDEMAAEALLDVGVSRVVIGTAALEQPGSSTASPAVARPGRARARRAGCGGVRARVGGGYGQAAARRRAQFEDSGVAAVVVTQIEVDGSAPDLTSAPTPSCWSRPSSTWSRRVASVRSTTCGISLRFEVGGRRLAGVIVGKALYDGSFTVDDALAAATSVA